jgi:hypothetical protein
MAHKSVKNQTEVSNMDSGTLNADPKWSEYTIPERKIAVAAFGLMITFAEIFFPGGLIRFIINLQTDLAGALVAVLPEIAFLLLLIIIHEAIHYITTLINGHSPQVGIKFYRTFWVLKEPAPYVIALNQYISRNENIRTLIAPLVLINVIAIGVLLIPAPEILNYYARLALVVNTAGSIQDLYNVGRLLRLPEEADFVNLDNGEIRTFYRI